MIHDNSMMIYWNEYTWNIGEYNIIEPDTQILMASVQSLEQSKNSKIRKCVARVQQLIQRLLKFNKGKWWGTLGMGAHNNQPHIHLSGYWLGIYTTIFPMIRPLISSRGCCQSCRGSNLRFLTVLFRNFKIFIMEMLNKTTSDISGQIRDTVKFTDDQKIHSGKSTWNLKITVFSNRKSVGPNLPF